MPAGAPQGNNNAASGTEWRDAIRRVMDKYEKGDVKRRQGLDKVVEKLIDKALEGDMPAIKELGDRYDGKPAQSLELKGSIDTRSYPIGYVKPEARDK